MAKPKGIDWDSQPLGEFPDAHLAKTLNVAPISVLRARRKRGIVAHCEKKTKFSIELLLDETPSSLTTDDLGDLLDRDDVYDLIDDYDFNDD